MWPPSAASSAGDPAGGAGAVDLRHIDTELAAVLVDERFEPSGEQLDLGCAIAPFCGPNTRAASVKRVVTSQATS